MFSSALKSISSTNITANYSISSTQTSSAGPWKIYDCKKKSTGKPYSVFVFDKKGLDNHGSSLGRSSASAFKRATEEVIERLKKEASSLAKLRHPSVLELVEPVEETRGGGLQFVTEAVTGSLAALLQEKDDQERSGGVGGRSSRYVTEDSDGVRRRRELEIDELEIQKGLLQISKALEFLHENAGLVHGNLTPDAIIVNAKSDWKISGLAFCAPSEGSNKPTSFQPISLSEVLNPDPRLPRFVQLNLDYTSPDFVIDNNFTHFADMFSLGLLAVALYNSPHQSPIEAHGSLSTYKRTFASSSTVPSATNQFLSSRPLPKELVQHVLPRLITRRPAQRLTAKEFQESEYFNNVLVSTIRFLDAFPAKTPNEKAQFMRGLVKVMPSFPKTVMEKKLLPALLEEMKDKDLIALILQNVFTIVDLLPSARRVFAEKVRPALKATFAPPPKKDQAPERDPTKDAGLMVVLEHMSTICNNCNGKEFTDDILPVVYAAIEAPTPAVVDAALRGLPSILPVLDFSTIKNELFPVIAAVFSKTSSLAIKVRGCQAFVVLCGGTSDAEDDGLDAFGTSKKKSTSSSSMLDKYTMQEKIIPLIKAIKTKEPAVMMAAHGVLRVVGEAADAEFVAIDILPILWHMSLGPLLNLKQFQNFMDLIKKLSKRVEDEQTRKLQELSGTNGSTAGANEDFMAFGGVSGTAFDASNGATEDDFESLVKGKTTRTSTSDAFSSWEETPAAAARVTSPTPGSRSATPAFAWSTPSPTQTAPPPAPKPQPSFRTVTPDMGSFQTMTPTSTQFSKPLQPTSPMSQPAAQPSSSINWSTASAATSNPWSSSSTSTPAFSAGNSMSPPPSSAFGGMSTPMSNMSLGGQRPGMSQSSSFSLPPPPAGNSTGGFSGSSGFSLPPPPSHTPPVQSGLSAFSKPAASTGMGMGMMSQQPMNGMNSMGSRPGMGMSMASSGSMNSMMNSNMDMNGMAGLQQQQQQQQQKPQQKSGLDKYESLI
ncbi:clathrin-coated vesicle protein [Colletotrichum scovillei]|uniref:SCY1 protein kinase n=1 Tax=Colletotrichum scovillei TaxID=1209932 RepID=A0A9P7U9D4_9PEZI|nr:clathrin-coated vesicle protein [Colletotrichum scovillei]KAF4780821.1 clathrin-coated vesicle protein [Colletotrichum scovillei]KAG7045385.1 SCY1 protein kinase [Colletotrichum scovillei]KAG7052547.1 SCY1 protein kinase [Colletotrichum scovillei]KAG7064839.1 SCY1 protein kinase [Colletotrichum scovillei]